jgi:hypothetical protein
MQPQGIQGIVSTARWRVFLRAALVVVACQTAGREGAADEPPLGIGIGIELPQPMMANLGDSYRSLRLEPDRDAFERVSTAIAGRHDLDFAETPLRDAVAAIAEKAGIGIGFDHESLEAAGIDLDAALVTGTFKDVSLRAVLREMLGDLDLDLLFRNERLIVATADAAGQRMVRYFYPSLAGTDIDALIELVERTVEPASWDTAGGPATVMPLPSQMGTGLVISQTEAAHEAIASLLRGLDAAAWKADPLDEGVEPRLVRTYLVLDPLLRDSIVENLADLCNGTLPHGADPDATVAALGDAVVVRSTSRPFHVMAAQLVTALQGLDTILVEDDEADVTEQDAGNVRAIRFEAARRARGADRPTASLIPRERYRATAMAAAAVFTPSAVRTAASPSTPPFGHAAGSE